MKWLTMPPQHTRMMINKELVLRAMREACPSGEVDGVSMIEGFIAVCEYLSEDDGERLSWRGEKPSLKTLLGLTKLAERYVGGYVKSDFPAVPGTVPDEMVGAVLRAAYGYSEDECDQIKIQHQDSMCAENCIGSLLERYLDSRLRDYNWGWCCGDFVKAIDFIYPVDGCTDDNGRAVKWRALQIKNRDNSENSSSSAIRNGTRIEKWFRGFSKKGGTNWAALPDTMQGKGLSEEGFREFVGEYLRGECSSQAEKLEVDLGDLLKKQQRAVSKGVTERVEVLESQIEVTRRYLDSLNSRL